MVESNDATPQPLKLAYARPRVKARWVLLGEHAPLEAHVARATLQSKGIPCNLADQNTAVIYSAMIGIDVRLQVLDCDLERARAVLDEIRSAGAKKAKDEVYSDQKGRCSNCRGNNVFRIPLSRSMLVLSLLLLGLPLLFMRRYKKCKDCRYRWQA